MRPFENLSHGPHSSQPLQDNDLERECAVHRTSHDYASEEFWKWTLSIMIGATMGTLAFLVDWGIDILNTSKYTAVNAKIYGAGALAVLEAARAHVNPGIPICYTLEEPFHHIPS